MTGVPMKEAVAVVLDVSMAMGGEGLQRGRAVCENLLEQKLIFAPRDEVGLILAGSSKTRNRLHLATPSRYSGVFVASPVSVPTLDYFKPLDGLVNEAGTFDMLEAIIVANDLIFERTEKKRYTRRIFLVTNAASTVKRKEDLGRVLESLKAQGVALVVIGIDFEEGPTAAVDWDTLSVKQQNERVLEHMCSQLGESSMIVPVTDALEALSALRKRSVGQRAMSRCILSIGDIRIPVQLFSKTTLAVVPSLKKVTSKGAVVIERRYFSGSSPGMELLPEERVKAFHYGRSVIPVSEVDEASLKFTGERALQTLGFIPLHQVPLFLLLGGVKVVAAAPGDAAGAHALAAFASSMEQLQRAMLVRFVWRTNSDPALGVCVASVKDSRTVLYFAPLPFAEDLRHYKFPDFRDVAVTNDQRNAVDQLVKVMTVSGDNIKPKEVFNPMLQQHYACVRHRFLHPEDPLPPLSKQLMVSSCCWGETGNVLTPLLTAAQPILTRTAALFPFEAKAEPATGASKVFWFAGSGATTAARIIKSEDALSPAPDCWGSDNATPHSQSSSLKTAIDISHRPVEAVSTIDPVGTFNALLAGRGSVDIVERAMFQMTEVILTLLRSSLGSQLYKRCDDCVDALRSVALREGEPGAFNKFLTNIFLATKGEAHEKFWVEHIIGRGVQPITKLECPESDLADAEAAHRFLTQDRQAPVIAADPVDDEEDLFGQLE
jgi:ATP-dependent DNA helicase 2 subunit 2